MNDYKCQMMYLKHHLDEICKYALFKGSSLLCRSFTKHGSEKDIEELMTIVSTLGDDFVEVIKTLTDNLSYFKSYIQTANADKLAKFNYAMEHGYLMHEYESAFILDEIYHRSGLTEIPRWKVCKESQLLERSNRLMMHVCKDKVGMLYKMKKELMMAEEIIEHECFDINLIKEFLI